MDSPVLPESPSQVRMPVACVEGASYTLALKYLATALMLCLCAAGLQVLRQGAWAHWSADSRVVMGVAGFAVLAGYGHILFARTRFDGERITQTGLWRKEVRLKDISQLKLIEVPGLSWLVVPRLVVRSGGPGFTTFQVADAQVLAALRRFAYG